MTQVYDQCEIVLAGLTDTSKVVNLFSSSFIKNVIDFTSIQHRMVAPLPGAGTVLAMAGYGACGDTEQQFRRTLHLPSPDAFGLYGYQQLIDMLNNVKENRLFVANGLFISKLYPLKPDYQNLAKKFFRCSMLVVDFEKNEEAARIISAWIAKKTYYRIKNFCLPDHVDRDTRMVFVNTMYFKGQWEYHFDFTENMPFYTSRDSAQFIPTMYHQGDYRYAELPDMHARLVIIPFKGREVSMVVIVPNKVDGLPKLEAELQNKCLTTFLKSTEEIEMELYLPKLKWSRESELKPMLENIGLIDAFRDGADFRGISDTPLMITRVMKNSFMEINEEGVEAAVITSVSGTRFKRTRIRSRRRFITLKIDRPSYYAIYHNHGDVPLFHI